MRGVWPAPLIQERASQRDCAPKLWPQTRREIRGPSGKRWGLADDALAMLTIRFKRNVSFYQCYQYVSLHISRLVHYPCAPPIPGWRIGVRPTMTTASRKESTFTQRVLLSLVTDLADLAEQAEGYPHQDKSLGERARHSGVVPARWDDAHVRRDARALPRARVFLCHRFLIQDAGRAPCENEALRSEHSPTGAPKSEGTKEAPCAPRLSFDLRDGRPHSITGYSMRRLPGRFPRTMFPQRPHLRTPGGSVRQIQAPACTL